MPTARLTPQQIAALDDLVHRERPRLLAHGIDIRLWGLADDGSYYRILYRGVGPPTGDLLKPFLRYGPQTVRFLPGEVDMLVYEDPSGPTGGANANDLGINSGDC